MTLPAAEGPLQPGALGPLQPGAPGAMFFLSCLIISKNIHGLFWRAVGIGSVNALFVALQNSSTWKQCKQYQTRMDPTAGSYGTDCSFYVVLMDIGWEGFANESLRHTMVSR